MIFPKMCPSPPRKMTTSRQWVLPLKKNVIKPYCIQSLQNRTSGNKARGRSRKRWIDSIAESGQNAKKTYGIAESC
uniref:Uncharacterized protein n=1 Tax=Arion vulgaris TaxID=1028688 RepID=A0A0B7AQD6_9EUPU